MAIFKCKMCGGTLEVSSESVAVCEYCGSKQTLPRLENEKRTTLYDRANHFRRNNEFDKAMDIYEQILNDDASDAEAYWSLVLCRYGIEYVEDPASHKRVPTVNRAQFTSIFDDDNYKSALQYADASQKSVYETEAKTINEIQKGILAISQKEEPFDVFICYKETDNEGQRTPDSVLAQDLYYQLTQAGFKVFFSRITLEDKLGSAYEPYIFAALNSAKVMVVLGTRPEFFNAVWVKNEWSRYLGLIKTGAEKMLVPAYRDMDPYHLPEEFSHLQAQDMGKLGFMQDLIRGISKIIGTPKKEAVQSASAVTAVSRSQTVSPLLRRAALFLESGDWENADSYCEKVLDDEPENAMAYVYKLMAAHHCKREDELGKGKDPLHDEAAFVNALRFADESTAERLISYDTRIRENIEQANAAQREKAERAAQEAAERAAQAQMRMEEIKRQKAQQEEERKAQLQLAMEQTEITQTTAKLKELQKQRQKAIISCILWAIFFWPIAIAPVIKIVKLSKEINETKAHLSTLVPDAEILQEIKKVQIPIEKKDNNRRIGMKTGTIICGVFAAIYTLIAVSDPDIASIFSLALFSLVLGLMFFALSKTPKKDKYMYFFGRPSRLKKSLFVILSIIFAFVLFGITMGG